MRKRFEQQLSLGVLPISEVKINMKSRHQLPPLLKALQYVFTTPELNSAVFELLEKHVLSGKKKTGRLGMSLWEILVLSLARLNLEIDYDFLYDQANNHETLRGILGVGRSDFTLGHEYKHQTLIDNVQLLDEDILREINNLIVSASHGLIKKKEGVVDLGLHIKVDSYVVESNIHFPTDLNLLWDSGRKCLDTVGHLLNNSLLLSGWGKLGYHRRKFKQVYRRCSEIHRKKGKDYNRRLKQSAVTYLKVSGSLYTKVYGSILESSRICSQGGMTLVQAHYLQSLEYYAKMLKHHIDLVERRIIKGEKIPHEEKIFSIFEPHVEWISKGKLHRKVELGHAISVATDQYHLVTDFEVMVGMGDAEAGRQIGERLTKKYASAYHLNSISFDRGYYSSLLKQFLSKHFKQVIMPKRGKKTLEQQEEESQADYQQLRRSHSAIESNINQLEHNGLNRCPDKGLRAFKRYVALGILSYNLHRMGKLLIALEMEEQQKRRKAA